LLTYEEAPPTPPAYEEDSTASPPQLQLGAPAVIPEEEEEEATEEEEEEAEEGEGEKGYVKRIIFYCDKEAKTGNKYYCVEWTDNSLSYVLESDFLPSIPGGVAPMLEEWNDQSDDEKSLESQGYDLRIVNGRPAVIYQPPTKDVVPPRKRHKIATDRRIAADRQIATARASNSSNIRVGRSLATKRKKHSTGH
jgi:hypothetical protein